MPRKLSHYTLGEKIGEGGMGEVYRATDDSLGREVAIKLLPEDVARDEERLARFRREATLLASLNHTNIATLFGLVEDDGTHFLVMELVEGEDLTAHIARGPLDLDDFFKIAYQIAVSLDAAHQKGVVHRDLKPGNIRITPAGHVKVLDFGLAKAFEGEKSVNDLSQSPTIVTGVRTVDGVILGTAAYMSPEQARGRAVDRRADVWAFGCVLYEMLTAQQTFSGDTVTDVLARILEREPEWKALPEATPLSLVQLLHDCLQKDPVDRWRDMGDAGVVLKRAASEAPDAGGPPTVARTRTPLTARLWAGGTVALAIAAIAFAFSQRSGGGGIGGNATETVPVLKHTQLTVRSGPELDAQIGADGKFIVYTAVTDDQADILLQRIGGHNTINLTKTSDSDEWSPAISPDGEKIAFVSDRQGVGIFVMGSTGESVRKLASEGSLPAWSPDGRRIAYTMEDFNSPYGRSVKSPLWILDIETGEKQMVFEGDAVQVSWSPSGERLAFWSVNDSTGGQRDIQTIRADGTGLTWVTQDKELDWHPVWGPEGRFVYFLSDRGGSMNVWRVPVDETTGEALGAPQPMTVPSENVNSVAVSGDGRRMVTTNALLRSHLTRVTLDPDAETASAPVDVTRGTLMVLSADVSPDGEWVAFQVSGAQEDVFLVTRDGATFRQLTDDPFRDRGPSFSPDGEWVVMYSDRSGRYELWAIRADGSEMRQLTRTENRSLWYPVYAPDGKRVAARNESGTWIVNIGEQPTPDSEYEHVPNPDPNVIFGIDNWSPDGKRMVGRCVKDGDNYLEGIYVYDFESKQHTLFSEERGNMLGGVFLNDNRRIVCFNGNELLLIDTSTGDEKVLQSGLDGFFDALTITRDNKHVLFTTNSYESDIWMASWE